MADSRDPKDRDQPESTSEGVEELLSSVAWPTWDSVRATPTEPPNDDDDGAEPNPAATGPELSSVEAAASATSPAESDGHTDDAAIEPDVQESGPAENGAAAEAERPARTSAAAAEPSPAEPSPAETESAQTERTGFAGDAADDPSASVADAAPTAGAELGLAGDEPGQLSGGTDTESTEPDRPGSEGESAPHAADAQADAAAAADDEPSVAGDQLGLADPTALPSEPDDADEDQPGDAQPPAASEEAEHAANHDTDPAASGEPAAPDSDPLDATSADTASPDAPSTEPAAQLPDIDGASATPATPATPPDPFAAQGAEPVVPDALADTRVIEVFDSEPAALDPVAFDPAAPVAEPGTAAEPHTPFDAEPESIAGLHVPPAAGADALADTRRFSPDDLALDGPDPRDVAADRPGRDRRVAGSALEDTIVMPTSAVEPAAPASAQERLAETVVMPAAEAPDAPTVRQAPIIRRADRDRHAHASGRSSDAPRASEPPVRESVFAAGAPAAPAAEQPRPSRQATMPLPPVPASSPEAPMIEDTTTTLTDVPPAVPPAKRKRRGLKVFLVLLGIVLLLAAAYAVAVLVFKDTVPRGATISGVEVGGMKTADAATALTKQFGQRASSDLAVTTAEKKDGTIDPKAAGLSFDAAASVADYKGYPYLPEQLWQHLVGVDELPLVTNVDDAKLTKAVEGLAKSLSAAPVEGSIVFKDGKAETTKPQDGVVLDTPAAVKTVAAGWLTGATPLTLPTTTKAPDIDQADVDAGLALVTDTIESGPVTIQVAGHNVELPADALLEAGTMTPVAGKLEFGLDDKTLLEQVRSRLPAGVETASEDAHFEFKNGKPVIVAGKSGLGLNGPELATSVAKAAQSTTDRTVEASLTKTSPTADVAALEKLGVKEKISEFHTHYSSNANRTQNLRIGASLINGVLVKPGETFSLSDTLGPRTVARGFRAANVVVGGVLQDDIGGGLSQLSTTVYNASHLGGMEDVEHTPHGNYFPRYPPGREATLWAGQIDNKFKNNTPYGVVVQAWLDEPSMNLYVALWSTHYWDVKSVIGDKTGFTSAPTIHKSGAGCTPQASEGPGFTVSYWRTLSLDGVVKKKQTWTWTYSPSPTIVCDKPD